jgi:Nop53 (60S ribosomal biogenesis)
LKEVAKDANPVNNANDDAIHDPWAVPKDPPPLDDSKFDFLEGPKPVVAPSTLKQAPISLAANGKRILALQKPRSGTSYNPLFEDWDRLLTEEGEKELQAEKKRLEEARKEQEKQRLITEAKDDDGEAKSGNETEWEGFESEYEKPEWLNKKRPERKTQSQRNKIKRRKEAEREAKWEARMKKPRQQVDRIKEIAKEVQATEKAWKLQLGRLDKSPEEGDDSVLRRRPLGKNW